MYSPPAGQGGRRKQSRIVVNVEDVAKRKGARAGRSLSLGRGGRVLSVAALVVVALTLAALAVGYFWWQGYKQSPSYSLALLVDAARRDDSAAFEQLIDSDRVAQSLAPQVFDKALASTAGMGALPAPRRQIEAALPNLLSSMKDEVRAEVARVVKEAAAQGSAAKLPFFMLALAPRVFGSVREEQDLASVKFDKGEGRSTEMMMQREGERWKVIGFRDDELAANIAKRIVSGLPAQAPAPAQKPRPSRQRR